MEHWLQCELATGQLQGEVAVRGTDFSGEEFALFAPAGEAQADSGEIERDWKPGLVRVELLDADDGHSLIYLPGQTLENGQTITVRSDQLRTNVGPRHCV